MDSLSSKIDIKYRLNKTKEIDRELILTKNYKLLADIEGELEIYINQNLFFTDEYMLLMEFGITLMKWIQDLDNNNIRGYSYTTMDFNDGPILEFVLGNHSLVNIRSEWQNFQCDEQFSLCEARRVIEKFLDNLKKELQLEYGINLADFIE
ncbi:DUF7878 domain-containing protein [Thermaerobacillus caldiproteolyticus]|uniref:DUF7878 domain-containing protein n=1 Tax=Thermaerobacillus caldiproteolyticus TaxID=247480 RepID=UPI0018F1936A|nr:hypothetical protein [Anoxybacillus caldiproteolyticus]